MKLKKHLKKFVYVLLKILDEQNSHRMYRKDLIDIVNMRINDKRYTINQHQLPKIINAQDKYDVETAGRQEYEFKEKTNDK